MRKPLTPEEWEEVGRQSRIEVDRKLLEQKLATPYEAATNEFFPGLDQMNALAQAPTRSLPDEEHLQLVMNILQNYWPRMHEVERATARKELPALVHLLEQRWARQKTQDPSHNQ